ncbi:MAG: outer membrane protein assembly factor BamA [Planctomyces sp.]|nr:outer membrane protein assembly factor BamA [Planctomyces sp.]
MPSVQPVRGAASAQRHVFNRAVSPSRPRPTRPSSDLSRAPICHPARVTVLSPISVNRPEPSRGAAARLSAGAPGRRACPARGAAWSAAAVAALSLAAAGAQPAQPPTPISPILPAPATPAAPAAGAPAREVLEDRPVRDVIVVGLKNVPKQLVLNQIRTQVGQPFNAQTYAADVRRLERLGVFSQVSATGRLFSDGTAELTITVTETPIIQTVDASGNRAVSDQDIAVITNALIGTPVDRFQIDRVVRSVQELYLRRGFYQASVSIDERELAESGIVLLRIREGDRLRVTDIRFEGNAALPASQLRTSVRTEVWNLFTGGVLDDAQLDRDVGALVDFYRSRGFLDARVDRALRFSPDNSEVILTFVVQEGPLYTIRGVRVVAVVPGLGETEPAVFSPEQVRGLMELKPGDVAREDTRQRSLRAVLEAYLRQGYVDAQVNGGLSVNDQLLRVPGTAQADLLVRITEGGRVRTGAVFTRGNELTQHKVIRREIPLEPGRPLDGNQIERSRLRLLDTQLFDGRVPPRLTVQPARREDPATRDVLAEVVETNTGSLSFGAALSSDSGVLGSIELTQRNFDIGNPPDSLDELLRGQGFRGAGQSFNIALQPGNEIQNYQVSFSEPSILETAFTGSASGGFRVRDFEDFQEERIFGSFSVGRRFGDRWSAAVVTRLESIRLGEIDADAPVDLTSLTGSNQLAVIGLRLRRTDLDRLIRPTQGAVLEFGVDRAGFLGDSFEFTRVTSGFTLYAPVLEDSLGRKTVLSLRGSGGFIPEAQADVPLFERFFLGGRELRGFRFRGVGEEGLTAGGVPTGVLVGGRFLAFGSVQLEQPLFADAVSVVGFIDAGTVQEEVSLNELRVAAGIGLRLYLPQLGPAPLAFDFAFPLRFEETDQRRLFSFSVDLPF